MAWILPTIAAILLIIFLVYSILAVNHARKFRYISRRTKFLTTFYIATTSLLFLAIIILSIFVVDWSLS